MDNVRDRLLRNQADEFREHSFSFGSLMAGAIGPDGGMVTIYRKVELQDHRGLYRDGQERVKACGCHG